MPLPSFFASGSPFDAEVEKATNERNTAEDWALIMQICDKVARQHHGTRDCLKAIAKRLTHKVPFVVLQALTLLDACVNNCGRPFHLEVSSRDFLNEIRGLLSQKVHPKVAQKTKFFIKKWAEMPEIKKDKSLNLLCSLYESLKKQGTEFSDPDAPFQASRPVVPSPSAAREEDDVARAIALSLEQAEKAEQAKQQQQHAGGGGMYPSTMYPATILPATPTTASAQDSQKVRALYDFEAAEDNELTFKTGELLSVTDDSDANWWKGFNARGEGLFPANFVTADLSVEPHKSDSDVDSPKSTTGAGQSDVGRMPEKIEINEGQIDEVLVMIQNADPTGETNPDTPEMLRLEALCKGMGPLIDTELQQVDRDYSQLLELNQRVTEALQMYHQLMRDNPAYAAARPAVLTGSPLAGPYPQPGCSPVPPGGPQAIMGQPMMFGASGQQPYYASPGMPPVRSGGTPSAIPVSSPVQETPGVAPFDPAHVSATTPSINTATPNTNTTVTPTTPETILPTTDDTKK